MQSDSELRLARLRHCKPVFYLFQLGTVQLTTHVVRLKLFRLKAEGIRRARLPYFDGMWFLHQTRLQNALYFRFLLTVFSLQPIHLNSHQFYLKGEMTSDLMGLTDVLKLRG